MRCKGVYTALVTPFTEKSKIDEAALRELVEAQIKAGITGLVPMGTTGESPTVSHEEHINIIEIVIDQARGRVPVIAGAGSNSTQEAIELTRQAMECGAEATLQVAPYYNKPNQEGFYRHFTTIADTVDLPFIVYNIPGRSGKNIQADTIVRLGNHENIIGVKEASGNFPQIMDILAQKPEDFAVLSGDDNLSVPMTLMGGKGVISVASNIVPGMMLNTIQTALRGDAEAAREKHNRLLPLFKAVFIDTNPIPIKYMLHRTGSMTETYRLPLCPLTDDKKSAVDKVLSQLGVL